MTRLLAWLLVAAGLIACGPEPPDAAARVARRFADLYFEQADPAAAAILAADDAALELAAEIDALAGRQPPDEAVASAQLVSRESFASGAVIKYRVRIRVPPDPGEARGTPAFTATFALFLRDDGGGWKVVEMRRE